MTVVEDILRDCTNCDGSGEISIPPPGENATCPSCGGSGKHPTAVNSVELVAVFNDVIDKLDDILEEVQGE